MKSFHQEKIVKMAKTRFLRKKRNPSMNCRELKRNDTFWNLTMSFWLLLEHIFDLFKIGHYIHHNYCITNQTVLVGLATIGKALSSWNVLHTLIWYMTYFVFHPPICPLLKEDRKIRDTLMTQFNSELYSISYYFSCAKFFYIHIYHPTKIISLHIKMKLIRIG